jgi:hypothetical protein
LDARVTSQKGIDQKKPDLFIQSVDIARVVDSASDTLLDVLRMQAASGNAESGKPGMLLVLADAAQGSGQADLIKQLLLSEVKTFVATGISGGYFAGTPDPAYPLPGGSLAVTLAKLPQGRREIRPGKILSVDADRARVSAQFNDPGAGSLPLELGLERQQGRWRVVEIINARSLFHQALKY